MPGLLLIDHGSRRAEANEQLSDMAARVRCLRPADPVVIAHLEVAEPTIAQGFAALVAAGAREVVALPYFLSDGRHSREDIPRELAAAAAAHPGVGWRVGAALGPHDLLATLLLLRAGLEPA
ncbi:MAG TPA: CbiX/SirB N-terminal domain-containing protein [Planctomycetota bacterium]|nr:CbiX/SirB N-terminal domain-containing protein [Planctomycetota bacterium]